MACGSLTGYNPTKFCGWSGSQQVGHTRILVPCAYHLAMKIPGSEQRVPILKQMYDEAWLLASDEDRDKASLLITPQIYYVN